MIYEKKSLKFVRIVTLLFHRLQNLQFFIQSNPSKYIQKKKKRNLENRMIDDELSICWKWTVIKKKEIVVFFYIYQKKGYSIIWRRLSRKQHFILNGGCD